MKVLLLEDCEMLTEILCKVLADCSIKHYTNPKEAMLDGFDGYDLLISDNEMPGMTGEKFIRNHYKRTSSTILWSGDVDKIDKLALPSHVVVSEKTNLKDVDTLIVEAFKRFQRST